MDLCGNAGIGGFIKDVKLPEWLQCMNFDERSDIFSFGIVLCELIWLKVATADPFLEREIPGFTLRVCIGLKEGRNVRAPFLFSGLCL